MSSEKSNFGYNLKSKIKKILLWFMGTAFLILVIYFFLSQNPQAYSQWVRVQGVNIKSVQCLASTGNAIFAGTDHGILRSTDNGLSWSPLDSNRLSFTSVNAILIDGNDMYAGTYNAGVLRSTNGGTSWFAAREGQGTRIFSLAIIGSSLFAGTNRGVRRTTDCGRTWQDASSGVNADIRALAVVGNTLLACCNGAVLRSTNKGISWSRVDKNLQQLNKLPTTIVSRDTQIFVGSGDGVFRSTDYGINWTSISTGISLEKFQPYAPIHNCVTALDVSGNFFLAGTYGGMVFFVR